MTRSLIDTESAARKILREELPAEVQEKLRFSTFRRLNKYVVRIIPVKVFAGWELIAQGETKPWLRLGNDLRMYFIPTGKKDPMAEYLVNENRFRRARVDKLFATLYPAWNAASSHKQGSASK